jgi:hypothetical protein
VSTNDYTVNVPKIEYFVIQDRHLKVFMNAQECNVLEPPVLAILHDCHSKMVSSCWLHFRCSAGFYLLRRIFESVQDPETLLPRILTMIKHGSSSGTLKQNRSLSWFINSQKVMDTNTGWKNHGQGVSGFAGNPTHGLHAT